MSQFLESGGQNIGVSASTSVLPMNTQDWSPLGLTDLISLQAKGLSRVFSSTTIQKHQFFSSAFFVVQLFFYLNQVIIIVSFLLHVAKLDSDMILKLIQKTGIGRLYLCLSEIYHFVNILRTVSSE